MQAYKRLFSPSGIWWLILSLFAAFLLYATPADSGPERVVSTNLCTDQLLLLVARREKIASVTYLSLDANASYMAEEARGIHINHGRIEEILPLEPDLILTGPFSARSTSALLRNLGYRVIEFDIASSFEEIRRQMLEAGDLLNERDKADLLIDRFNRELQDLVQKSPHHTPLAAIYGPNGYTAGKNTLEHVVIEAAGMRNLAAEKGLVGYGQLSLENLINSKPDLLVLSASKLTQPSLAETSMEHPVLEWLRASAEVVMIPDRLWRCGGTMISGALTKLLSVRKK